MFWIYNTEACRVVVCALLLQRTYSAAIQQPESNMHSKKAPIHKRSEDTMEFFVNSDSYTHFMGVNSDKEGILSTHASNVEFNNNLTCPGKASSKENEPVNKRSTCPWYYSMQHDAKRYPATVLNAEGLCDYAISSDKSQECVPITQHMSVLRLQDYQDEKDKYVWVEETITIVTGYTAAARRNAYSHSTGNTTPAPSGKPTPAFH